MVTPMGSSLRFGGTMEMSGLNEDINSVRVRGIISRAVELRWRPDERFGGYGRPKVESDSLRGDQ